jgi:2-oxoglutarate ferredoxin oxidoreductase subunit beta
MNKEPKGLDSMHYYQDKSIIQDGADPKDAGLELNGPIVVGKFVDVQRPTLWDHLREVSSKAQEKANGRAKVQRSAK